MKSLLVIYLDLVNSEQRNVLVFEPEAKVPPHNRDQGDDDKCNLTQTNHLLRICEEQAAF